MYMQNMIINLKEKPMITLTVISLATIFTGATMLYWLLRKAAEDKKPQPVPIRIRKRRTDR